MMSEMKPNKRTLVALLNLVLLLSLMLALTASALAQGPGDSNETLSSTAQSQTTETSEQIMVPVASPTPINCDKPIPGQVAKVIEDNEILVTLTTDAGWDNSGRIQLDKLDNKSNDSTDLVYFWDWRNDHNYRNDVIWPVVTAADVDGDGKDEVIGAFKDLDGRLQVISLKNPEVNDGNQLDFDSWTSTSHNRKGQELNHFDIAAGDLDGRLGGDKADEVVVAFRDNDSGLQVVLLNGESDGGISYLRSWRSSNHARGYVGDVSVDIGDLDGDGYDDEIVLAFADGDQDQQVVVLEYTHDGVKEIGWDYWASHGRGDIDLDYAAAIDVTVGDFDGDFTDEIAVAIRDGSKALQITQIVFDPDAKTLQGRVNASGRWRNTGHLRNDVDFISAASGDIDDDGYEEIVIAFADKNRNLSTVTLDAESGSPSLHGSYRRTSGQLDDVHWVSVDAGDIDGDNKAEIVIALQDGGNDLRVLSYDDNPKCPCGDHVDLGLLPRDDWQNYDDGRGNTGMVWVALGDVDGDSVYADYTGQCKETQEMRMIAIANRPPYWEDQNPSTDVAYGTSVKSESSEEDHITNSYGGSVSIDDKFELGEAKIGPTFSMGWETSTTQSWTKGSGIETRKGWTMPEDGIVALNNVHYYAYQYKKRDGSGLARVSVPIWSLTDGKKMSIWNQDGGSQDFFPDSWAPAYRSGWMDDRIISESVGDSSQGAGSDYYDIDGNGKPDYLFAWIDNPAGENVIYYRFAWDVHGDGNPSNGWSDTYKMPEPGVNGLGWENSGLGVALTELNGNDTPELVVAWVANPQGNNWAAYRIGWDLDADGKVSSWSGKKSIPGWVGGSTQGVGLDIFDLNGNGRPEMFFGWIDNPDGANHGWYRVGWNLDANGDSDNWWSKLGKLEGAFGLVDAGLGLTVADMDGNGQPELIAAWVRDLEGQDEWAYTIGENLDGDAYVDSWTPGYGIPSWLRSRTAGVALASANLNHRDELPELVISWIDDRDGANKAWLQVGKYLAFGGEVDQRPTDVQDDDPDDGKFKIKLYDAWWNVNGKVVWRWDEVKDDQGNSLQPIYVSRGGANPYWKVERTQFSEYSKETSQSFDYEIGGGGEFFGLGVEGAASWGFDKGASETISWEDGLLMDGVSEGLPITGTAYSYVPFTYMQEAMSKTGVNQAYMVLDYLVPMVGSHTAKASVTNVPAATAPMTNPSTILGVTPLPPIVASPSHPDPNTWYATNSALFTWTQPDGDPAVVDGYRWYLDHNQDTIPDGMSFGLTDTTTYKALSDGQWWLHLRARGDGGDWSETAHLGIRVDANPPQVEITLDPPLPLDNGGWYNTPVTAAIDVDDGAGSGVQSVEFSTDGVSWQPYTDPIVFATDSPPDTLWARATDRVGHVSEPVSTTFGLDLTLPTSIEGPDCWEPGGDCLAGVIIDATGNQRLRLSGQLDASLSGEKGLSIEINSQRWISAQEIGEGRWSFTSDKELGAGCHTFNIQGEDRAGNVEALHVFGEAVVWHPQDRPDLSGSSLSVTPTVVRPGDTVTFIVSVPNSSWQETWVPISVLLPTGLEAQPDTISGGGVYDPTSRLITWPPRYLWPGETNRFTFSAQVDDGLPATKLNISLTALGTWPIAEACPAEALPGFLDMQTTVERSALLLVDPALPDDDILPPTLLGLKIEGKTATQSRDVQLDIPAGGDPYWMYLREWTWNADQGAWIVAQESGWLHYSPTYSWTLSERDGVKYLGVWLADEAWNVSSLDRRSLTFTNLMGNSQFLAAGQRIQYRFPLQPVSLAVFNVIAKEGNPDLYVWQPYSGFLPHYSATGTGFVDAVGFEATKRGPYLVEVKAEGDSRYQLLLSGDIGPSAASASQLTTNTPVHPLTVSDPLSAGVAVAPTFPALYLPMMTND